MDKYSHASEVWVKLRINSQTSTVQMLKFGNLTQYFIVDVIFIHTKIKAKPS